MPDTMKETIGVKAKEKIAKRKKYNLGFMSEDPILCTISTIKNIHK